MPDRSMYPIVRGNGPTPRTRSGYQKAQAKRKARAHQQEVVVALSDFLPRPLTDAWNDGRKGKQRWWGNLLNHGAELIDSDTPPTFEHLLMMAEVLAWHLVDLCEERGIPVELPDPPTPIQGALLKRRAA